MEIWQNRRLFRTTIVIEHLRHAPKSLGAKGGAANTVRHEICAYEGAGGSSAQSCPAESHPARGGEREIKATGVQGLMYP